MANRYFKSQFSYSFLAKLVHLYMRVTIGAAGAPTLDTANSKGIKSIVQNGTGDYTVTLQDKYIRLLSLESVFDTTGGGGNPAAAPVVNVKAQAVSANGGGTVRLLCSAAGVAANPANGEALLVEFDLSDSNA